MQLGMSVVQNLNGQLKCEVAEVERGPHMIDNRISKIFTYLLLIIYLR